MTKEIEAYRELEKVILKYHEKLKDSNVSKKVHERLKTLEMEHRFGVPLRYIGDSFFHVVGGFDHWTTVKFCSQDENRPNDEWLYIIGFPRGAYIFGDSYPNEIFKSFFKELKGFGAKYVDYLNSNLYFTEDVSRKVYKNFWNIYEKHKRMVDEQLKIERKKKLEDEISKLDT